MSESTELSDSRASSDSSLEMASFLPEENHLLKNRQRYLPHSRNLIWILHSCLLLLWVGLILTNVGSRAKAYRSDSVYSPVNYIVRETNKVMQGDLDAYTIYKGPPSTSVDKAWEKLMSAGMIRLSDSDLEKLGRSSYRLYDGSGHLGFVDVFHQLHCLNVLRMCIYSGTGRYPCPDTTGSYHTNHCVDVLRQAIMCHADTNIITWDWEPGRSKPIANGTVEHTCKNFEDIYSWTLQRRVSFKELSASVRAHNEEMGFNNTDDTGKEGHMHEHALLTF